MKINHIITGFVLLLSLLLLSCGPILKVIGGLHDPVVYSQEEINENIAKLPIKLNTVDVQLKKALDEEEIKAFIFMSIPYTTYIYNSDNKLLCYNGETSCVIDEISELQNFTIDEKYVQCESLTEISYFQNALIDFNDVIGKTTLVSADEISHYTYKVFIIINTDIAKKSIVEDWNYIYDSLNHNENIVFVRVWTDLNENWGLKKGKKAKFKVRKVKGEREVEVFLKDLPYIR